MRILKIIALAVFLQMQFGFGYVFAQSPQAEEYYPPGNTSRLSNAGTRMVGRTALPLAGGVLTGNEKVERVEHYNFQDAKTGKQNAN